MPLYIDHHKKLEGLTAEVVAEDHKKGRNLKGRFTGFPPKLILGNSEGVERAAVVRPQLCDLSISGFQAPP